MSPLAFTFFLLASIALSVTLASPVHKEHEMHSYPSLSAQKTEGSVNFQLKKLSTRRDVHNVHPKNAMHAYPPISPKSEEDSSKNQLENVSNRKYASVNIDLDVLGIGQAIAGAISSHQNRDAFVKNLRNTAFYNAGSRYNVMVFNLNVDHAFSLSGVKMYASANYDGIIFGIWVFESGWFENKGDGGYTNWAFMGWFDRNDGHVSFH